MILTKKEINDLTPNLGDLWRIKSSHFKAIDRIKGLEEEKLKMEYQKDQAETMLQELVEAAEWRDELVCFYTTTRTDKPRNKNGWWDRFDYENCRKADAEAAYQVALKAAKSNT